MTIVIAMRGRGSAYGRDEWEQGMRRDVIVGRHCISIEAVAKHADSHQHEVSGYSVRYTIARADGKPVRTGFPTVRSYELNLGVDLFPTTESAFDYGEEKARDDISTF